MKSIASGIRTLSEDEKVRQPCEARDKVLHDMASRYSRRAPSSLREATKFPA